MWQEFKEFAVKGNAMDMAVGIIIGAAFGAIVTALVEGVIMPPIGLATGGVDFSNLFVVLDAGTTHVVDADGLIAAQLDTMPGGGLSPTSQWRPGELHIDTYRVHIPATTYTPNEGRIAIGLYAALTTEQSRQRILEGADPGPGTIQAQALHFGQIAITPPSGHVPNKMTVRFDDNVTLVGYHFSQRRVHAGETLSVTLFWQARGTVSKEYTSFVHLLDANFRMFGGHDGSPATPTLAWTAGAMIEDVHSFVVSPETPAGNYQIELGLYDEEQDRLSLLVSEGAEGADRLLLGPLEVVVE